MQSLLSYCQMKSKISKEDTTQFRFSSEAVKHSKSRVAKKKTYQKCQIQIEVIDFYKSDWILFSSNIVIEKRNNEPSQSQP